VVGEWQRNLERLDGLLRRKGEWREITKLVVYGGDQSQSGSRVSVVPWRGLCELPWAGRGTG